MAVKFVIIGGGPGGNQAATYAARLGAQVTLVERDIVGGAAHLWDCIPSKAMIATGGAMSFARRSTGMGLADAKPAIDMDSLAQRVQNIENRLNRNVCELLESQGVRVVSGTARLKGPHEVVAETADGGIVELDADAILISTGSRPRIPDFEAGVSAARAAGPSRRYRIGRHRRGVRPHVQLARFTGDVDREPPASAAPEGSRGGGCARG
jgi:NAD(P)H dehydrogenase (quinone)